MRCQNLAYKAVMWIQKLRIRFRVQNFGPIWICYQFKQNVENNSRGKKIFNKICFKAIKKYRHLKFNQLSLGMENFCLYLYTFCLVYPFFPCVDSDPYSEYGSTKLMNTDPMGSGFTIQKKPTACSAWHPAFSDIRYRYPTCPIRYLVEYQIPVPVPIQKPDYLAQIQCIPRFLYLGLLQ